MGVRGKEMSSRILIAGVKINQSSITQAILIMASGSSLNCRRHNDSSSSPNRCHELSGLKSADSGKLPM